MTITLPTIVIGAHSRWDLRKIVFLFQGPIFDVGLSRYFFHLIMQDYTGQVVYEEPIGQADSYGRLDAGKRSINYAGGRLTLAGLRTGEGDFLGVAIQGSTRYSRHVHGPMLFKVSVIAIPGISHTDQASQTHQTSQPTTSVSVTSTFAPGGIGASAQGTVTQPGDTDANGRSQGNTTSGLVATQLQLVQVAVPR